MEQFSLSWDNFHNHLTSGMHSLFESGDLVDVTLAVEGKYLKAHKMVLSVCSPYFRDLFKANPCKHPIVFMKDISYSVLCDLLQFMYQGEVQINKESLNTFLSTAEALHIKGLTEVSISVYYFCFTSKMFTFFVFTTTNKVTKSFVENRNVNYLKGSYNFKTKIIEK